MASTLDHYENHLAPVYSWMAGGIDDAIARGRKELQDIGLLDGRAGYAVDLGAGFGMHAVPLAMSGCKVLALDSSTTLLKELETLSTDLEIDAIADDLLDFPSHLKGLPDTVLCMGDTLTHLPEKETVIELIETVSDRLASGGRFVTSFRDYTEALTGAQRFIPVKNDAARILTCFLEYREETIDVYDTLHEYAEGNWNMRVSSYRKLRLDPMWVEAQLGTYGFDVSRDIGLAGMIRLCATRA